MSKKRNLTLIVVGLMLAILISAMDNTIVATAMGTIIAHLGGLDKLVWVTSAYMVTEMAGMPIFGKLSDMYGRKRFFVFGIIVFLIGSALCGTATNITELIIYRAIQGVGGGALMPIAFTIVFDVFPVEQRGKMSGLFGATFGLSSIFGPLLGAYITQYVDWRWVFYINLPIGIASLILLLMAYHESVQHANQRIDWLGVFTLVPAIVSVMFALQLGGNKYNWDSGVIITLFALFVVLLGLFLFIETKATEPIISYSMFRSRLFAGSTIIGLFSGAAYVVAVLYIPIFIQGVQGGAATNSGLILLPMMLGTVVSSQVGAQLIRRLDYRTIMLIFGFIFLIGMGLLGTLTTDTSHLVLTFYMIIVGFGIGASFSVLGVASINDFDVRQYGAVNSTISFIREFGMTVGITVFGILERNNFAHQLTTGSSSNNARVNAMMQKFAHADPHAMLTPETRTHIPASILTKLSAYLAHAISHTFLWTLIPAGLAIAAAFIMTRSRLVIPVRGQKPEAHSQPQQ
jgi:EmrB/QacA subfamily drug resistance transporter